jgi:hypothetical protein
VLRRIFRLRIDEVTGERRRLQNKELYGLYSASIIRLMKSRRLIRAGHAAPVGRGEVHRGFWWGNLIEGKHLEGPSVDGRIILKWIFEK